MSEFYKNYRITRTAKGRTGEQGFVAVRGNVAVVDLTLVKVQERVDRRQKYDDRRGTFQA